MAKNAIFVIRPYRYGSLWVFDDERVDLVREAFVAGMDAIIDTIVSVRQIPDPDAGFTLAFSDKQFPGADFMLQWQRPEGSGNIYRIDIPMSRGKVQKMDGWLCSALGLYYARPPRQIHIQVRP